MFLKPFQEIFGNLNKITNDKHWVRLKFTRDFEIEIPNDPVLIDELKTHIGKRIGIINIDGNYHIRELK